jgi:hypothetical protein
MAKLGECAAPAAQYRPPRLQTQPNKAMIFSHSAQIFKILGRKLYQALCAGRRREVPAIPAGTAAMSG